MTDKKYYRWLGKPRNSKLATTLGSARNLWVVAVQQHIERAGGSISRDDLIKALLANPPTTPKQDNLKGKRELPLKWLAWMEKHAFIIAHSNNRRVKVNERVFVPLNIAVLTVSDSRTEETDKSGQRLVHCLQSQGHILFAKQIVADDIYLIRAVVAKWIADRQVDVILTTGGTGVTGRDGTPEAVGLLLDKTIVGFGEMFRMLSYAQIKTSTLQSRAIAGVANGTYIFCLPGSIGACILAWDELIQHQLDYRTKPCNLVELIPRLKER